MFQPVIENVILQNLNLQTIGDEDRESQRSNMGHSALQGARDSEAGSNGLRFVDRLEPPSNIPICTI